MAPYYPLMVDLRDRPVLVVGGGEIAARKARSILAYGPRITMVAREAGELARQMATAGEVELHVRPFHDGDLDGTMLVIAATDDPDLHEHIKSECDARRIFCNVVDVTPLCSFIVPSIIRRGNLMLTISTDGLCPAYSKYMRKRLTACCFGEGCDRPLYAAAAARNELKAGLGKGFSDEEKFDILRILIDQELPALLEGATDEEAAEYCRNRIGELVDAARAARGKDR